MVIFTVYNMRVRNIFTVGALLISSIAIAQFSVTGDFRTLGEMRHGYMQLAVDTSSPAAFVSQRSRIGFAYKKEKLSLKMSIQDVRTWGEDDQYTGSGTFGDSQSLQTAESWMQYNFTDSLFIKLGRQAWVYDEQRLLSGRDRNQAGLFYDALLLSWKKKNLQTDVGLSFNNTGQALYNTDYYVDKNKFQSQNFIYIKHKPLENISWSAIGLATGYHDTLPRNNMNFMYTGGLTTTTTFGAAHIHAEGYYQTGKNNKEAEVSAYLVTAHAKYKLLDGKVTPGVGVDYYSGHDASNTDEDYAKVDHTFDIMYGARYKFNGNMNQFMFVGKPYEKGGLQDLYATLDLKLAKKHIVKSQFHSYSLSNTYASPESKADTFKALDKALGYEIDLVYIFKINKQAKVTVGGGYFSATDSFRYLKGQAKLESAPSYYVWASLQFTPELFNSKTGTARANNN